MHVFDPWKEAWRDAMPIFSSLCKLWFWRWVGMLFMLFGFLPLSPQSFLPAIIPDMRDVSCSFCSTQQVPNTLLSSYLSRLISQTWYDNISPVIAGFLSTGDANSPGNYGLLDQAMAIRWIHDNIGYFNGDRDAITLFGPDAGAASAGLLMLNPRTRSLIARVIAQVVIVLFACFC